MRTERVFINDIFPKLSNAALMEVMLTLILTTWTRITEAV